MLGSQNAISGEVPKTEEQKKEDKKKEESKLADDIAKKVIEDMTKQMPAPAPAPAPAPTPAPGPTPGPTPTPGPAPAPEKELPKPSIPPPYLLPSQRPLMDEWNEYLKSRYGQKEALPYVDKVVDESQEFTALSAVYQYLLAELRKAQRKTNKTNEWVRNAGLVLSHFAVEGVAELIKSKADGVGKFFTDKIKDQLNKTIGGQYTDIEGAIKNAINAIFVGYERWKGKLVQTVEDKEGEPEARDKIQKAGQKVIGLYRDYKLKKITLADWKNSQAREDYEDLYEKYTEKYGKPPYFDKDPLKWNTSGL
jgi:hypothetical protein